MNPVLVARRWLPLVALVGVAIFSWNQAQAARLDETNLVPIKYAQRISTPVLSPRRLPRTLRAPLAEDAIVPEVERIAAQSTPTSCFVVAVDGEIVSNLNGSTPLIPASNEKILTTWAALDAFGPDHRFSTTVRATNATVDGILDGDLYFIGGGDPFLVTDRWINQFESQEGRAFTRLEELADRIAATGIAEVTGTLYGDETTFDSVRFGPWHPRLNDQKQSGPLSALSVNQGFVDWPDEFSGLFGSRDMSGDPALNAAHVLSSLLSERGVSVANVGVATTPSESRPVAQIESATLLEIVTHINSYSDNYGAEMLAKHLGLHATGVGSTEAGAEAILARLAADPRFPMGSVVIRDGSGLTEDDRVTCELLVAVLSTSQPDGALGSSLSIGGERGSLNHRFDETEVDGQVLGKSGTLNRVTALSGIVLSDEGPDVYTVFSIIVNGELASLSTYEALEEELVLVLGEYPDAPPVDALGPRPTTD